MTQPVALYRAAASVVRIGGTAVTAMYGPLVGGLITNPSTPLDQGIPEVEVLYVDLVGDAVLGETATTVPLQPGQSMVVPSNQTTSVSVNAATSGHRFSAVVQQTPTPFPPTPTPGPFPPSGPTSLRDVIPSYLYQQFNDDSDLQAFVDSFNNLAQRYVTWFNDTPLPVYTDDQISESLLDWVALGLYGVMRPALSSGANRNVGPYNTWTYNLIPYNTLRRIGAQDLAVVTDDMFKRILTWRFSKTDGKVFNIRWLKRRVLRFLIGVDGSNPNIDSTYQVSVTFGVDNQVNINLLNSVRTVTGGSIYNRFGYNSMPYNAIRSTFQQLTPLPNALILKEAIESGVLELPFQYDYVVNTN